MLRKSSKKSVRGCEDIHHSCTVRFLDETEPLTLTFQKDTKGQYLIDQVCAHLELLEKDYFGLRYVDADKQRHWLEPSKSVQKQLKNVHPMVLCFRVKYYPSDPMRLKEEITKYYLFLQLRRDLHHGRLLCTTDDANLLSAHIAQSEFGDYDQIEDRDYISKVKLLPKQSLKHEDQVAEIHKTLKGQSAHDVEENFLEIVSKLDTYGVDPHPVKDQTGGAMYLGVTHLGIITFQGNKRTHLFKWPNVVRLGFEGKHFIVNVLATEPEPEVDKSAEKLVDKPAAGAGDGDNKPMESKPDNSVKVEENRQDGSKTVENKPDNNELTETKLDDNETVENKPTEDKPAEEKADDNKPGEIKSEDIKTADNKQDGKKTAENKPDDKKKKKTENKADDKKSSAKKAAATKPQKQKKHTCSFKCPSTNACKHLWKCAVQQQYFFTLSSATEAPKVRSSTGLFRRGSTYRFSGHCEVEACSASGQINREPPTVRRSSSNPQINSRMVRTISNLHAATLPRDANLSDLANNDQQGVKHSQSFDVSTGNIRPDALLLNASIPEETAIEIADTSYAPVSSPDDSLEHPIPVETLESTPLSTSLPDSETASPSSAEVVTAATADLDAQILELRQQLDEKKAAATASAIPADNESQVRRELFPPVEKQLPNGNNRNDSVTAPMAAATVVDGPPAGPSKLRSVLFAVIGFMILAVISMIILFEVNSLPFVLSIRRLPGIKHLRRGIYRPLRAAARRYLRL